MQRAFLVLGLLGCGEKQDPAADVTGGNCDQPTVSWSDVSVLVEKHCVTCHADGTAVAGAQEFQFRTYDDFVARSGTIFFRIEKGANDALRMPKAPSPALTDSEQDVFATFKEEGFCQ
jgi:hypothetical protein